MAPAEGARRPRWLFFSLLLVLAHVAASGGGEPAEDPGAIDDPAEGWIAAEAVEAAPEDPAAVAPTAKAPEDPAAADPIAAPSKAHGSADGVEQHTAHSGGGQAHKAADKKSPAKKRKSAHKAKKTTSTKTTSTKTTSTRTTTSITSTTKTTTSSTITTTTTTTGTTTTTTTTTVHHVWGANVTGSAFKGWLAKWRGRYRFGSPCGVVTCLVPSIEDAPLPKVLHGVRSKVVLTHDGSTGGTEHGVQSEGVGFALMVEGMEALSGDREALENALGLARGWLAMVRGPEERAHPLGGGGSAANAATHCSAGPYGVSAVKRGDSASGLPVWKWPLLLCEGGCEGSDINADQDAILGMLHLAAALDYPEDFVDMVVRALVAFASADLGFPDLYRTLPDGTRVYVPKGGSSWGGLLPERGRYKSSQEPWCYSPGHFAPAHYRVFRNFLAAVWTPGFDRYLPAHLDGTATGMTDLLTAFDGAIIAGYNILYHSSCSSGAVSNWVGVQAPCPDDDQLNCDGVPWQHTPYVGDGKGTCSPTDNSWGSFGVDSSSAVWRVAMDFVLFREESAQVPMYGRDGLEDPNADFTAQLYLNRIADQYVQHSACDGGVLGTCLSEPGASPWKLAYAFEPRTRAPNVTCSNVPNVPMTWWTPLMAFPSFTAFVAPFPGIIPEASTGWMETIASTCDFGGDEPRGFLCSDGYFEISQAVISTHVMARRLRHLPDPPKPNATAVAKPSAGAEDAGDPLFPGGAAALRKLDDAGGASGDPDMLGEMGLTGLAGSQTAGSASRLAEHGAAFSGPALVLLSAACAALLTAVVGLAVLALRSSARRKAPPSHGLRGGSLFAAVLSGVVEPWEAGGQPASYDMVPPLRPHPAAAA